jgi:hypothetical protein
MKATRFLAITLATLFHLFGYGQQPDFGVTKNIIITGSISNYDVFDSPYEILIQRSNLFGASEKFTYPVSNKGEFKIELPISLPQEMMLVYGGVIGFIARPGDSLHLIIDDKLSKEAGKIFSSFTDTISSKTNNLITKFYNKIYNDKTIFTHKENVVKDFNPDEYTNYIASRSKAYWDFKDQFISENETTPLFVKWVEDHLKFEKLSDLMRYSLLHHNGIKQDSSYLPTEYFKFLAEYDSDHFEPFSYKHFSFIQAYHFYSRNFSNDLMAKLRAAFKSKNYKEVVAIQRKMVESTASGFIKEIFMARNFLVELEGLDIVKFNAMYDRTFTSHPYILQVINDRYN